MAEVLRNDDARTTVTRKIVITSSIGGGAFLLTNLTDQPVIWTLTMSAFIGGVSLVIQFLIDFDRQLRLVDQRQRIHFRNTSKATALFGRIDASELRIDPIVELVQYAAEVDGTRKPLLNRLVSSEIRSLTDFLRKVSQTMITDCPGEESDWLFALVDNAARTIKATSTIGPSGSGLVDEGFWESPLGFEYLEHQRDAIRRSGLVVRRIFIVHGRDISNDAEFRKIVSGQREAGIEVRVLPAPPVNHSGTIDFILFDDEISYEFVTGQTFVGGEQKPAVLSTQLVMLDRLVRRRQVKFDEWWERAIEPPRD